MRGGQIRLYFYTGYRHHMDGIAAYLFATVVLLGVAACAALALKRMWSLDGLPDLSRLDNSPEEKYASMSRLFSSVI